MKQNLPKEDQMMDILLVMDKETKSVKAVKGINENGELQTVPPKKGNETEFLKIDTNKNLFENFFSNFMRQLKEPTRFHFFRVGADKVEEVASKIQENIKNPTPSGNELMAKHKVNTENMEKNVKEENPQTQETKAKENNYRFDESKVNWDMLKDFGLSKEKLQENNVLDSMLKGSKSPGMYPVAINLGDVVLQTDARLSFRNGKDGEVVLAVHGIKQQPELEKPFFGHKFSDADKENLLKTGNMGRLAETKDFRTGETHLSYISLDKQTNELVAMKAEYLRIPDAIKGVKLDENQKQTLREGKPIYLEGMTANSGKEFSATLQVNAEKRGLEFIFNNSQKQEKKQEQTKKESTTQEQSQDGKKIFIKNEIGGQKITKEDKETLLSGGTIYKEGIKDKQGELYNAYIKINPETNKLKFYKDNPDQGQVVAPGNEHRQQVAANNDGKKSETNKHVDEPFKKEQNDPTEKQQEKKEQKQEQEQPKKSKGMKM